MKLKIAETLLLPIEIASQAICLFGIRGSGKTNTAGALAEELLDHHCPIVVIDPTDAWWGLRAGMDGRPGYQVFIFGGSHADLPLQETDGKIIAEFLVREQVPAILSLRHLRKAAQRRFVTEFCEELYHLKGRDENRTPLTVFIDEAPLFVPQKVLGEVARTVGAVEDLIARGRNAGFGVVLISQRSATLNADVRTQADTIICHRVTAPLDRKAIAEWFEQNASVDDLKSILQSLATLKNGEAWAWAPSLGIMKRVQMRLRRTFDSSATPRAGAKVLPPKNLAEVDIEKLKGQLAASIEAARNDDPRELRKRIAALEGELRQAKNQPAEIPAEVKTRIAEETRLECELRFEESRKAVVDFFSRLARQLKDVLLAINQMEMESSLEKVHAAASIPSLGPPPGGYLQLFKEPAASVKPVNRKRENPSGLGRCERAILTVLAQREGKATSKSQASILSGYSIKSSGFSNALSSLRTKDFAYGATELYITRTGLEAIGPVDPLPIGAELVRYWQGQLGLAERTIFGAIVSGYPRAASKEKVAELSGYSITSSGFSNALSKLRTLELIEGRGELRASATLFEG